MVTLETIGAIWNPLISVLKLPEVDVIAFDPGKRTGVVWIERGTFQLSMTYEYAELRRVIETRPFTKKSVWVCEDFITRPQYSTPLSDRPEIAARVIGMLDLAAYNAQVEVVLQSPSNTKRFATDKMLKQVGWFTLPQNGHERDAARHALFYLVQQKAGQ